MLYYRNKSWATYKTLKLNHDQKMIILKRMSLLINTSKVNLTFSSNPDFLRKLLKKTFTNKNKSRVMKSLNLINKMKIE